MRALHVTGLALALLAGCGTTYSASYERPSPADAGADRPEVWFDDAPPEDAGDPRDFDVADVAPAEDLAQVDRAPEGRGPPYPIVLVHGFAGFQNIGPVNYFFNVARTLRDDGNSVYEAELPPFQSPDARAAVLATFVDRALRETQRGRVILIAHSQGGLDSRFLISSLGYGDRVAALVTVSSPHRGTRLADLFLGIVPGASDALLNTVAGFFGILYNDARARSDLRASLTAMSEANIARFNAQNPDDPRVIYWSYAGRSGGRDGSAACGGSEIANNPSRIDLPFAPLAITISALEQGDPARHVNDGLVEVQSARWGRFMGCVPADHFDEIGQIAHLIPDLVSGFDHRAFYRDVVHRLRREGF